jgi:protein-tyrosine phosphatase
MRIEFDDKEVDIAPEQYLYLPTVDDTAPSLEHLRAGVEFIAEEIRKGGGVYVHCGSGVGRAPTVAAAYLISTGLATDEAWARIRRIRPFIRPQPQQMAQLRRFAGESRPKD